MKKIVMNFILYLTIMSGLIFVIGVFEIVRNDYMFNIVEDSILIEADTPTTIYATYETMKADNIFTNTYFIFVLNFIGILGLFYILVEAFKRGWNSKPKNISDVFINYGLLWIILFYILLTVFNYIKDVFVTQILVLLFNDITNEIFIFNFFVTYFIGLFFIAILLNFFANQIRHFRTIDI